MTGTDGGVGAIHPDRFERLLVIAFDPRGEVVIGLCASAYPGRRIADLSISVAADGVQRSFHTSRRSPDGPLSVQVDEPGLGWRAAVGFTPGEGGAVTLPPRRSRPGGVRGHDSTTEVRWGSADVELDVDGFGAGVGGAHQLPALQRRSWGVEPIDATPPGAPDHELPQQLWWFASLDGGAITATGDEDEHGARAPVPWRRLRPSWEPGTRRLHGAAFETGTGEVIDLAARARFAMRGLGFVSPTWPHGVWHDEVATGTEEWLLDAAEPNDVHHLHLGYVVGGSDGDGAGWVETLALGPHAPSGLTGFTDGYRAR